MFDSSSGYYPNNRRTLQNEVERLLSGKPSPGLVPKLIIAPHGGINDCGEILGKLYSAVDLESFNNVVVLCPSPVETGPELGFVDQSFRTPLGDVDVDTAMISELKMTELFEKRDDLLHLSSVEMQLVFLQMLKQDFRIVPITVSEDVSDEKLEKGMKILRKFINPQDLVISCTNMATGSDTSEKTIQKQDSELIDLLRDGDAESFAEKSKEFQVDGSRAVLAGLKLIDGYSNVHVLGHRARTPEKILKTTTTGYAGLCLE